MSKTWEKGYVHVYTGNGKGKTTAAIGLAVRAVGAGLKVFIGQFIKGRPYSELTALERFGDAIQLRQFGRGCFIYNNQPEPEDIRLAEEGLREAEAAIASGDRRLVILDEANVAVSLNLFGVDRLLELIERKPANVELVITGRGADPRLIERADLVTEMTEIRHYYHKGIMARDGIEC